ncbi:MAG: glycosyltransferase family 2 protein [Terricaulis sp.]
MTTPRRVSVIVPTRERPAMLRNALASIRALEGDDLTFEILVGDNGKLPETRLVAEEFGAIYLTIKESGSSASRNAGLRAATSEYFTFLDDDDVWLPGHIRPHLAMLDAHPELETIIGQVIYTDKDLKPLSPPFPEDSGTGDVLLRRMLGGFFPQVGTSVSRISVREKSGPFDLELFGGQDLDWLLRAARRRTMGFTPTTCLLFRGREPGTYDALNFKRIAFDRQVFLRHGLPEWRIFKSPLDFSQAYSGTLMHFYNYFVDAADVRAEKGQRLAALKVLLIAWGIFPLRGTLHLMKKTQMQHAFVSIMSPRPRAALSTATAEK